MTDYAIYKALPADERDRLGFARWNENQRTGTHGPGCHAWGRNHHQCALAELDKAQHLIKRLVEALQWGGGNPPRKLRAAALYEAKQWAKRAQMEVNP